MASGDNRGGGALLTLALVATALGLYGGQEILSFLDVPSLSAWPASVFAAPFGLLIGVAMFEQWQPAIALGAVSVPVFWTAVKVTGELDQAHISLWAGHERGVAFLVGSVLGASLMMGALAYWDKTASRRFVLVVIAAVIATFAFVSPWSTDFSLWAGFIVWQVLVGRVMAGTDSKYYYARTQRIAAIALPALVIGIIGISVALRSRLI